MTIRQTLTPAELSLTTAVEIGRRICREAIWHQDRCTWLGSDPQRHTEAGESPDSTLRSLGSDLYSGTSGVALFLGELFAATGDPAFRSAALGAIRHALARADAIPSLVRLGLFSGWLGTALVAVRLGTRWEDSTLVARAEELAERALAGERHPLEFDLVSGRAGAIVALLALNEVVPMPASVDRAVALGDELVNNCEPSHRGISWKSRDLKNERNLTGFSHGASGPAYALLELYRSTAIARFRSACADAWEYERTWFDPSSGNWPDFRQKRPGQSRARSRRAYVEFWCHGAPGIALSRLRAFQLLGDPSLKAEALAGLSVTRRMIESALANRSGNFSLCHGLMGNAEILAEGRAVLGEEFAEDSLPARVAAVGAERFARPGVSWPCGTWAGETPNLMLGLAGIGYAYLRMYDPRVPSILLIQNEQWKNSTLPDQSPISS
jgi:lantibiotic modifying enzyme